MKTILIVDDERPARELLKMAVDWTALNFAPPIEASNGKQALALYRELRPDFIITDIQMPVMDGLELIAAIRETDSAQRIAILSNHESFSYAQRALHMGVNGYLLKDDINPHALAELLLVDAPRSVVQAEQARPSVMLRAFLQGTVDSVGASDWLAKQLSHGTYLCCVLSGKAGQQVPGKLKALEGVLSEVLKSCGGGEVCCQSGDELVYILAILPHTISARDGLGERTKLLKSLRQAAEQVLEKEVTLGVSTLTGDATLLGDKLEEAKAAQACYVFLGRGRTLHFDEISTPSQTADVRVLNLRVRRAQQALANGEFDSVRDEITALYEKDISGMMQYNYLVHVNTLLLSALTEYCVSRDIPFEEIFGSSMLPRSPQTMGYETVREMKTWFLLCFERCFDHVQKERTYQQTSRIQRIQQYIQDNCTQDISLELVAEQFHLHKVYLAKVFKAETGQSVNEYIRIVKTEKAKELLAQPKLKISAIVEMLGYHNPQTFYNMFRGVVGLSPKEFREQLLSQRPPK